MDGTPSDRTWFEYMIEDRGKTTPSYFEFLQQIQALINSRTS